MRHLLILVSSIFALNLSLAEESIKIGVIASISDEWAALGTATVNGVKLAATEINDSGGVDGRRIELLVEDSQEANNGSRAVSAFRSIRQRGVSYFIGPSGTPAAMALAPIVKAEPIVIITPSVGVRDFSDSGSNVFNSRGIDEDASAEMARMALQRGWKRAVVLSSQQPWELAQGGAFRKEFERLGGVVQAHESPLPETNDFRSILTKLLAVKPQVVFLSNYNRLAVAAKQLVELGYAGPKLSTVLDNSIVAASKGSLNGDEFASFVGPTMEFREKYRRLFHAEPDFGADTGYDALIALAKAMRQSLSQPPAEVAKRVSAVRFQGAAGSFSFDSRRIAERKLKSFSVKDGQIVESAG